MISGRTFKLAVVLLGGLTLSGCSIGDSLFGSSAEVKPVDPETRIAERELVAPEAPLDFALFEAYMDLAEARYYAGSEDDFEFFADRAIAVASGEDLSPSVIDPNQLSEDDVAALKEERQRLVAAQAEVLGRAYNPDRVQLLRKSAEAQALFDCRLRQAYADIGIQESEVCGRPFGPSLASLESAVDAGAGASDEDLTYVIYFDQDSTDLDILARAVIAEAGAVARKVSGAQVVVLGGAGRAPTAAGNALSALRAEAVARELEAVGMPVKINTHGPEAKLIRTGGDDPEVNRLVEIKIER